MRTLAVIAAMLGASSAQMIRGRDLYAQFTSCSGDTLYSYNACWDRGSYMAQCCSFSSGKTTEQFCVTDLERDGMHTGAYIDNKNTEWDWTCRHPEDKSKTDPDVPKAGSGFSFSEKVPYLDLYMDWTYWPMALWWIGDWWSVPVGSLIYVYLNFVMLYNFIEIFQGKGEFMDWLSGPFRRAVLGTLIFEWAIEWSWVPFLGILTSWGFLVWAKADYYDYSDWPVYNSGDAILPKYEASSLHPVDVRA